MVPSDPCVGAIVLAAGQSRRMGGNKLLEPLAGQPVIRKVVDAINGALAEPAVIVTGHEAALVAAAVHGTHATTVHAADFASGMSQSLRAGILAVPAHWDAVLVCLGDMPLLSSTLIATLAERARADRIIVPYCGGSQGNPVLWGRAFLPDLAALNGDRGAKSLMVQWPDKLVRLDWPDRHDFLDVDTPEALADVRAIMAARSCR